MKQVNSLPLVFGLLLATIAASSGPNDDMKTRFAPTASAIIERLKSERPEWGLIDSRTEGGNSADDLGMSLTWCESCVHGVEPYTPRTITVSLRVLPSDILDPGELYDSLVRDHPSLPQQLSEDCGFGDKCHAFALAEPVSRIVLKGIVGRVLVDVNSDDIETGRIFGIRIDEVLRSAKVTEPPLSTNELAVRRREFRAPIEGRMQDLLLLVASKEMGWQLAGTGLRIDPRIATCTGSVVWQVPVTTPGARSAGSHGSEATSVSVRFTFYPRAEKDPRARFRSMSSGGEELLGIGDLGFVRVLGDGRAAAEVLFNQVSVTITAPDLPIAKRLASYAKATLGRPDPEPRVE